MCMRVCARARKRVHMGGRGRAARSRAQRGRRSETPPPQAKPARARPPSAPRGAQALSAKLTTWSRARLVGSGGAHLASVACGEGAKAVALVVAPLALVASRRLEGRDGSVRACRRDPVRVDNLPGRRRHRKGRASGSVFLGPTVPAPPQGLGARERRGSRCRCHWSAGRAGGAASALRASGRAAGGWPLCTGPTATASGCAQSPRGRGASGCCERIRGRV